MIDFATLVQEKPTKVAQLSSGKSGALLCTYRTGMKAVVKPVKDNMPSGKTRQRGILISTHPYRECAYYQLAKLLGFDHLVPETVMTTYAGVPASAQQFVPAQHIKQLNEDASDVHAPGWRNAVVATALKVPKSSWRQLLALDIIAGARDRHANNVGLLMSITGDRPTYRLVAWDNAVTFGLTFARYHNVFHKYLFRDAVDFTEIWPALDNVTYTDMLTALGDYITEEEVNHAFLRLKFIRDDYPYRLPWTVCSQGAEEADDFPAYVSFFEPSDEKQQALSA